MSTANHTEPSQTFVQFPDSPADIASTAARLRAALTESELGIPQILAAFETWAAALSARELDAIPGVAFLRLWLRRGTIEPMLLRELGPGALNGNWSEDGLARLKPFPVGVVGHWPAGNIEIQPILSLTCGLLGGNAALVRVPRDLVELIQPLLAPLAATADGAPLLRRIAFLAFDHDRRDLQEAMAAAVDGAMIWGGKEAVTNIRSLPFPPWAKLAVFGPRLSVAAMDAATWCNATQHDAWCQRIARDVWQFDQQACSSPQTLFLEKSPGNPIDDFVSALRRAFEIESRQHPRATIHPALTSAICQARARWLLEGSDRKAFFTSGPDWTILTGAGVDIPPPTQGRTLTILEVESLLDPISKFDGSVQTLGVAMADAAKESELAQLAARHGVDRVIKLGRMHLFVPPWDGSDLIRPMVRVVRHLPSAE